MFDLQLYLTLQKSKTKKQSEVLLHSTVLLLIPTVCCQDVMVPARDNVAIIFASTLLPPLDFKPVALRLKGQASAEQRFNCLRVSMLHLPR